MLLSLYKWSSITIIPESECRRVIAIAGLSLYKRKMDGDGSRIIPIQEDWRERWIYPYTRGIKHSLLTFLVHAEREE